MTVGTTLSQITVLGDDVNTTFVYPFIIPSAADAVVIYTDLDGNQTTLLTTQFTITGLGLATGGTVTYPLSGSPIATGTFLTIRRLLPLVQTTSVQNQGPTFAALEGEDDYLTMITQQLNDTLERTIQLNVADIDPMPQLPPAAQRAGQLLAFDDSGNPIVGGPSSAIVSAAMQPVVAASTTAEALRLLSAPIVFDSITTLRSFTGAAVPACIVRYYSAAGDGGGGVFYYNSASSDADNGGTIIVDGSGRRWFRQDVNGWITPEMFGAKGDATTDDTTALQAALAAIQGTHVALRLQRKRYVVSATLSATASITIEGVATGVGPGIMYDDQASELLCSAGFTTGDVISVTTQAACFFRNFSIVGALGLAYTSPCPRTSGYGIAIRTPNPGTSVNFGSKIENMGFAGIKTCIYLAGCGEDTLVANNYFSCWGGASQAIFVDEGGAGHESACGQIVGNQFFGQVNTTAYGLDTRCGYGMIVRNKFLLSSTGIRVVADGTVDIGNLIITGNSFEENVVNSIFITTTGRVIASTIIQGNQFSNIAQTQIHAHIGIQPSLGGAGTDLYDIDISDNNFNSILSYATGPAFITVQAVNVTIANNRGRIVGGTGWGVVVQSGTTPCFVTGNMWQQAGGTFSSPGGYLIQETTAVVVDLTTRAINVAALPTIGNGSMLYVIDGKATNFLAANLTVIGAGAGCIAQRMVGAWLTIQTS